ncbi:MAG: type II toxin-antitoxin system PemK/MazF family toxin [Pyrinomonadaceae bacterium]|nr:type II toxin-antitoxin system PemK/MazF family toxin [Pyrinomonadaceae bacterium]
MIGSPVSASSAQAKIGLTAVFLPQKASGLTHESVALCHQVITFDCAKLAEKIGGLSDGWLGQIANNLKAAMDLA